jgi:hypothetical protein
MSVFIKNIGLARLTMAIAFRRRDSEIVRYRAEQRIDRGKCVSPKKTKNNRKNPDCFLKNFY